MNIFLNIDFLLNLNNYFFKNIFLIFLNLFFGLFNFKLKISGPRHPGRQTPRQMRHLRHGHFAEQKV